MKKQITLTAALFLLMYTTILAQWQSLGSGIDTLPRSIFCLRAVTKDIIWGTSYRTFSKTYEVTKTTNAGINWQVSLINDSIGNYSPIALAALDSETAWVLMIALPNQNRVRLFKTVTGGTSWQEKKGIINGTGIAFAGMHFFNANEGVLFGSPGTGNATIDTFRIYRTSDGGDNWVRIAGANMPTLIGSEGQWIFGNNCYESYGDTLWCLTRGERVFKTIDRGFSWQAYNIGVTGTHDGFASIAFQNPMQGIVTSLNCKSARTTDGGVTWTPLSIPTITPAGDIEFVPGTASTYIITEGVQSTGNYSVVIVTKDGGNSWDTVTYSPAMPAIHFLSPTIGFGGGEVISANEGGIYKWTGDLSDSTTTAIGNINHEMEFKVYPNPATTQITVTNGIFLGNGKINIINLLGETVKETQLSNGQTRIDIANLPKGIYMVHLSANGEVQTEKLIVYY